METLSSFPILSLVTYIPAIFAVVLLLNPRWASGQIKVIAAGGAGLNLLVSLLMPLMFNYSPAPIPGAGMSQMQLAEKTSWLSDIGIDYHMGVDGVSMLLIILTTLISLIAILVSWGPIKHREREFYFWILLLETGMIGVFVSLNFFLFYIFWELMLIPMALLIGIWGSGNRTYAAIKFFLYTLAGSLLMLIAIVALYFEYGAVTGLPPTLDILQLASVSNLYPAGFQNWVFLAFAAAFAVKVPMFPVHTWLPDAHTQAPTAGSIILAGVMLKMGAYGFIRFALPITPDGAATFAPVMVALAVIGIIYGALVSVVQPDMKRLVAYSSVSHMGFVVLGLFTSVWLSGPNLANATQGIDGAIIVMLSHGFLTGGLFLCVGVIYDRLHSRAIADMGGLTYRMPVFSFWFLLVTMGSLGLPLLSGFVGEFLVMLGAFRADWLVGTITALVVIFAAWYLLWMFQRVMFMKPKDSSAHFPEINMREGLTLGTLGVMSIIAGVFPSIFLNIIQPNDSVLMSKVAASVASPEVVAFIHNIIR